MYVVGEPVVGELVVPGAEPDPDTLSSSDSGSTLPEHKRWCCDLFPLRPNLCQDTPCDGCYRACVLLCVMGYCKMKYGHTDIFSMGRGPRTADMEEWDWELDIFSMGRGPRTADMEEWEF